MSGIIYLMRDDKGLVEMREHPYDTEDLLQGYLADHPDLLAGDQINDAEPRKWLLISREMGVPSEEGSGDRWSADHLFLDQDAIPTIVEVKRSTDTRVRREVVAQMLDYAANGIMYWPLERLRSTFEANCGANGQDPETTLLEVFGLEELDPEDFWRRAATNLRAGKVRLIFVADKIPAELRRIVEFLNEQMNPAEVLAIEMRQHVSEDFRAFVPRVIGQTAQAERIKSVGTTAGMQWDEESFFEHLEKSQGIEEATVARRILDWMRPKTTDIWWGKGKSDGSFVPFLMHGQKRHQILATWTNGTVEIYFQWYAYKEPFSSEQKRIELLNRLNSIPDVSIPTDAIERRPSISLSVLDNDTALEQFFETFDWVIKEIERS